jgi:predicted small metal-binding protein
MCGVEARGGEMAKLIKCSCGKIVRGDTDDELLANAEQHIREDHPDMVGKIAPEDLLAMAEPA